MAFALPGKGGRFAYAQQQTCGEEAAKVGSNGGGEGGDTPHETADASYAAYAEFVQHHAHRKLAQGIGPVIGGGEIAEGDIGDGEGGDEGSMGDREVDAVEVVDQHSNGQQKGDAPAAPGDFGHRFKRTA